MRGGGRRARRNQLARPSLCVYLWACLAVAGAWITAQRSGLAHTEVDVTAEAAAGPVVDITGLPSWTLTEGQLGDLELLLMGAFAPLTGFLGAADVAAVTEQGALADGTPWPVPVVLDVPESAVPASATKLTLNDPEGTPLAILDITGRFPVQQQERYAHTGRHARPESADAVMVRLSGPVTGFREPEHGPFRALRRTPAQVRAELGDGPVLAFATRRPLNSRQIGQLRHFAGQPDPAGPA